MPSAIKNKWTVKKLLTNSYIHMRNRFDNKDRDVINRVAVKEVAVFDITTRKKRTKYILETNSYPQYAPYYTKKDLRGRPRQYQRTYLHKYSVTVQLDKLSINVPVKLRTGSDRAWDFSPNGKSTKVNGRIQEGSNIRNGRNGDFFFRLEHIYQEEHILFGRNWTNGPPKKTNSKGIVFLDKHCIHALEVLMNAGVLKDD